MKIKENKSLLLNYLGDTPQLRVLDFLIDNHFFDYPITEISKGANVSYNSLKAFFGDLVTSAILIKTRKVGKSDYYKLNINNVFIANLMKLDWIISKKNVGIETEMPKKEKILVNW